MEFVKKIYFGVLNSWLLLYQTETNIFNALSKNTFDQTRLTKKSIA